mgnify:CR=1 FL=1
MARFKIGDKVKASFLEDTDEDEGIRVGDVGVVTELSVAPYVQFSDKLWAMSEDQLEYADKSVRTYTPGQLLNSAAEVMQALLDGEKIVGEWILMEHDEAYRHLVDGHIVNKGGSRCSPNFYTEAGSWIIYAPKRKVKTERWFAVFQDAGGPGWSIPFPTEERAKGMYPNALAYVRAECEVEVD